jgi:imidazolonepropionase-like amidohydrolase
VRRAAQALLLACSIGAAACGSPQSPAQAPAATPAPAAADVLVLNNFTLIDGNGGPAVPDSALIATDGRITWIGPKAELKAPAGAAVQDLTGKFVMPGLIDLHTHVSNSDVTMQDPVRFFTREGVTNDLHLYASYGTTTVASLGTDQKPLVYDMRAEQRKGRPSVARIFTAGRGFTVKDGFPTNKGNVPGIPYEPSTPAEAAADMEELAAEHPDVVKIWVDDRFGDFKKTPIEISRPIIDGAHKHGIKVIAHVFYLSDAKQLAAAGLDAFGHSVRDRAVDDELINLMKQHGTWIIPTLYREWATFMFEDPKPLLNDPFFARGLDARQKEVLASPEYHKALVSDKYFPRYPGVLKTAKENLKRLADAGVRIGYGTDSGVLTRFEGFGEHMELQLMVEAGMTPSQVIKAATKDSAEFLGQLNDLGTLEKGKWADLIVLGADPLANIRNSRQIDAVYIAGNKVQ